MATRPRRLRESVRERVHHEVVSVLKKIGEPVHINDLAVEYERLGYQIPGQGKPANLAVHLSGWDDIANPSRGMYALKATVTNGKVK